MTRDENRADLQRHADDFHNRKGFTYTVLDPASRDVIGCVYIYPLPDRDHDARTLSWVQESHAHLDMNTIVRTVGGAIGAEVAATIIGANALERDFLPSAATRSRSRSAPSSSPSVSLPRSASRHASCYRSTPD